MTRPRKQEVDYFPHYCEHGKVIYILENYWGNDGYAVFYKLIELLAKTEGHCYNCSTDEGREYLFSKMGAPQETVTAIIEKLAAMGVIDEPLWGERRIWMQSFVDSISMVYGRRAAGLPIKPALLHTENPLNGINVNINPQSKVKESKVKESKVNTLGRYSAEFETFWKAYPRKVKKDKAWEAWKKRNGTMPPIDTIVNAIENQKKCSQWIRDGGQYIPHPATWINAGQWMDEDEAHPMSGKVSDKTIQNMEMLKEWRPPL